MLLMHHCVFHILVIMGFLCLEVLTLKLGLALNTFAM